RIPLRPWHPWRRMVFAPTDALAIVDGNPIPGTRPHARTPRRPHESRSNENGGATLVRPPPPDLRRRRHARDRLVHFSPVTHDSDRRVARLAPAYPGHGARFALGHGLVRCRLQCVLVSGSLHLGSAGPFEPGT